MKGLVLWLNSSLHPKMLLVTMAIFTWSWQTSVDFREIITRKEDDGDVFLSVLVRGNVYKKIKRDTKGILSSSPTTSPTCSLYYLLAAAFLLKKDVYKDRMHFSGVFNKSFMSLYITTISVCLCMTWYIT